MSRPDLFSHLDLPPDSTVASRVETIDNALVVPATTPRNWVIEGGVFDAGDRPVALAQGWHFPARPATVFPELPEGAASAPLRKGHYFYLGHYIKQFGQFLLESTARLWHLHFDPRSYDGMVMLAQPGADRERISSDIKRFMALCGWEMPPLIWSDAPERLERLTIPVQASGALNLMMAAPEYRDMIHARFGKNIPPAGPEKLYISRTEFIDRHGSLVEEKKLEELLAAEGFVPFHPQNHSLEEQIAHYRAAKVIAGVDGSAFHLVSLVIRPEQRVVLFQRRPAPEVRLQAEQLRWFGAGEVTLLPAAAKGWSPAGIRRSALSVFGITSFPACAERLAELGLVSRPQDWVDTEPSLLQEKLRAIGTWLDADMYEVSSPSQSLSGFGKRNNPRRIRLIPERRWQRRLAKK